MKTCIMTVLVVLSVGCSALPIKKVDANAWVKDYYNQPRSDDLYVMEGTNMTIAISGLTTLRIRTQLPIISVIPREPSWVDSVSSLIPTVGMTMMGIKALDSKPTVIQTEPLIVKPEVITP